MKRFSIDPVRIRRIEQQTGVDATDLLLRYREQDPGIVGVAYGPRVRGGQTVSREGCVTFFVEEKRPQHQISPLARIPALIPELYGAPSDVIGVGTFVATSGKYRPAPGGVSISGIHVDAGGTANKESGTLACRASRTILGGKRTWYALGNAHVMAQRDGSGAQGDVISQPSYLESALWQQNQIALLKHWIPITSSGTNHVDAAIAAIDNNNVAQPTTASARTRPIVSDVILDLGRVTEWRSWRDIATGLQVAKRGAGLDAVAEGEVSHVLGSFHVLIDGVSCLFANQIVAQLLTVAGDSGALLVTREVSGTPIIRRSRASHLGAVGLVFACNNGGGQLLTLANYIEAVHLTLNVRVADREYQP